MKLVPATARLAVLVAGIGLSGCRPKPVPSRQNAPPPVASRVAPKVTLQKAHFEYKDPQGRMLWTVEAKSGAGQLAAMTAQLQEVRCVLYDAGKPTWNCKADTLNADKPTQQVQLQGHVIGRSTDGEREFDVPSATWNVQNATITGGPNVHLKVQRIELWGDRLVASTRNKTGTVTGHVRGRVRNITER